MLYPLVYCFLSVAQGLGSLQRPGSETDSTIEHMIALFIIIFSSHELTRVMACTTRQAGRRIHWTSKASLLGFLKES